MKVWKRAPLHLQVAGNQWRTWGRKMVRDTGFEPVTPTVSSSRGRARLGLSFRELGHDGSAWVNFKASVTLICHLPWIHQSAPLWFCFSNPIAPRRGLGLRETYDRESPQMVGLVVRRTSSTNWHGTKSESPVPQLDSLEQGLPLGVVAKRNFKISYCKHYNKSGIKKIWN